MKMGQTKISQYLHRPNLTELGMGNTHETYMLINVDTDLSDIFPPSVEITVKDKLTGKSYLLKSAKGREFRVNQMGDIYRDYDVSPGDEIIITKTQSEEDTEVSLKVKKYNRVVLTIGNLGAEIANKERLAPYLQSKNSFLLKTQWKGSDSSISISFDKSQKKRNDSPIETDFYKVLLNSEKLPNGRYFLELGNNSELVDLPKSSYNVVEIDTTISQNEKEQKQSDALKESVSLSELQQSYLTALRTKPFMLLAGISGTGKSRIVKEMAFQTCPDNSGLRTDEVTPGNYCLVEVKPNWHDSTELLGYDSVISGGYVVTKFVKFLVKAMLHPEVPFFVCLDEMNLAPVEQYFAEFLSVLESRKKEGDDIKSETLIEASVFQKHNRTLFAELFDIEQKKESPYGVGELTEEEAHYGNEWGVYQLLMKEGLRIPKNLLVVGTVNMDETTHQFSRKVIDRAMTIEMNIADGKEPFENFFNSDGDLKYYKKPLSSGLFLPKNVTAKQALEEVEDNQEELKAMVPERLAAINEALDGTPFKIAYRVQNELLVYFGELRRFDKETNCSALLNKALDSILMMKVLPRIEGDRDLLERPLKQLAELTIGKYPEAEKKIKEMQERLENVPFTSFWP